MCVCGERERERERERECARVCEREESHLVAYREVNVRVEFRADFLRQIVAEGRRILSHKFRALTERVREWVSE